MTTSINLIEEALSILKYRPNESDSAVWRLVDAAMLIVRDRPDDAPVLIGLDSPTGLGACLSDCTAPHVKLVHVGKGTPLPMDDEDSSGLSRGGRSRMMYVDANLFGDNEESDGETKG